MTCLNFPMFNGALSSFARWFASAAGVWQTAVLVFALVLVEEFFPHLDPQGFRFLYWLTVYSAVTQPALAFVGWQAGVRTDVVLNEELKLIREEIQMLRRIADKAGVE